VRELALERLDESGEAAQVHRRHVLHYLSVAEQAGGELFGAGQAAALARIEREHANLRAALRWSLDTGEPALTLRLAAALWRFWWLHGYLDEGRRWLADALEAAAEPSAERTRALNGLGTLLHVRGEYALARSRFDEALGLARRLDDRPSVAGTLRSLGALARELGEYSSAAALYDEALALERELGNEWAIGQTLNHLGKLARVRGDRARAVELLGEALRLSRRLGDTRGVAVSLHNLAEVARDDGDLPRANDLALESLALWRDLSDRWGRAVALGELGTIAALRGDAARAAAHHRESFALFRELDVRQGVASALEGLGAAIAGADPAAAARLFGAAGAVRAALGVPLPPADQETLERATAAVRQRLGEPRFTALLAEGRAGPLEAITTPAPAINPAEEPSLERWEPLTPREREVARLIARGRTNREIAESLVVAERTTTTHVEHILQKLRFRSRAQIAAWVAEREAVGPTPPAD
jgi:non-specific serine/threonine protein kinase